MGSQRRAFFRTKKSAEVRRAFVRRQQAKLGALRRAAACSVVPAGGRVVVTIPIPSSGGVGVGAGSVWVVDRAAALLFRVDPTTNAIAERMPGIRGAAPVVGEGALWVPWGVGNRVFRVDGVTGSVSELLTGPSGDEYPITAVVTSGAVWVGNHHGGTVARIDPRTSAVVASVPWSEHANGGIYHMTTDGSRIWVTASRTSDVAEIDTATNAVVRRTSVPTGACGGIAVDAAAIWVTSGFDRPYTCWKSANWGLSRIDRATGAVTRIDVGGRPFDVRVAFGSVWVIVDAPQLALVRLDPASYRIIGRLALAPERCVPQTTGNCPGAEYATALAVGFDSLWVRRSAPDNLPPGQAPPALLRIQPTPLGAPRPGLDSASESVVAIHTAHALSKNAPPDRSQGG
jgi:streptogramin lyase